MNFKVGDIIIPKKNLLVDEYYSGLSFLSGMKEELYSRSYWRVESVDTDAARVIGVHLEGALFAYSPVMLEPLLALGHLVQFNDDSFALVAKSKEENCLSGPQNWFPLDRLDKNLTYKHTSIKRVYGLSAANMHAWKLETIGRECIWERETEKKEMTIAEIEKKLGYSIKVIKEDYKEYQF